MSQSLLEIWERTRKTIVLVTHSIDEAIYLSSEVHALGVGPGRIIDTLAVPLPYPRDEAIYEHPRFADMERAAAGAAAARPPAGRAAMSAPARYGADDGRAAPLGRRRELVADNCPRPAGRGAVGGDDPPLPRVVVHRAGAFSDRGRDDPRSAAAGRRSGGHRGGDPGWVRGRRRRRHRAGVDHRAVPAVRARALSPDRLVPERAQSGARADLHPLVRLRSDAQGGVDRGDRLLPGDAVDPDRHRSCRALADRADALGRREAERDPRQDPGAARPAQPDGRPEDRRDFQRDRRDRRGIRRRLGGARLHDPVRLDPARHRPGLCGAVVVSVVGVGFYYLVEYLEKLIVPWSPKFTRS